MTEDEIRELVGELIVAGFDGTTINHHAKRLITDHRVKNIILFKRNVESAHQVTELNESLQELARESGHELPLIICTDQENGIVRRVAPGVPGLPGNMAVGATGNPNHAYEVGKLTAKQLLSMGINMDLAPVLDVNNNAANPVIGVRSYGENPDDVAAFGAAMVEGLQESGVIACGKHFPGHGDTSVDSHLALPEIAHPRERLETVELKPFIKAMEVGVDVIMTAHVVFSSIEPKNIPATLSKTVLTDFLRAELGYQGVITTDCLEMNAISETIGVAEGAVQALLAGADFLMISHRLDRQEAAIEAVVQAVLEGRVSEEHLRTAAARVRNLRETRLGSSASVELPSQLLAESEVLQQSLCAAAATVVSNKAGLVPLSSSSVTRVDILVDNTVTRMVASDNSWSYQFILDAVKQALPDSDVSVHHIADSVASDIEASLNGSSLIIAGLNGVKNPAYIDFVNQLAKSGAPVVAFALQSPYDLKAVANVPSQVAIYEYTPWMVQAGIHAMLGIGGTGRLPVTL